MEVDYVAFGLLLIANFSFGLYFSFFRRNGIATPSELFLGSRSLRMVPLALSTMASCVSGVGIIGFSAHFYAYGMHILWTSLPILLFMVVFANGVVPLLYGLKVTSMFEVSKKRGMSIVEKGSMSIHVYITCHNIVFVIRAVV